MSLRDKMLPRRCKFPKGIAFRRNASGVFARSTLVSRFDRGSKIGTGFLGSGRRMRRTIEMVEGG